MMKPMLKLALLRRAQGLTGEELAWKAGTNRVYISRIENGRREPTADELKRLARALHFKGNPAELLTEVEL
jgi:transcriptional regulator with XRE-family HTH domain